MRSCIHACSLALDMSDERDVHGVGFDRVGPGFWSSCPLTIAIFKVCSDVSLRSIYHGKRIYDRRNRILSRLFGAMFLPT
jgi:hypothetical protein